MLDWIEAALPQQNAGRLGALPGSVLITLDGPGGRVIRLGQGAPAAHISSGPDAFVRWVTQRGSWAELGVRATGGEAQLGRRPRAARVLSYLRVVPGWSAGADRPARPFRCSPPCPGPGTDRPGIRSLR